MSANHAVWPELVTKGTLEELRIYDDYGAPGADFVLVDAGE